MAKAKGKTPAKKSKPATKAKGKGKPKAKAKAKPKAPAKKAPAKSAKATAKPKAKAKPAPKKAAPKQAAPKKAAPKQAAPKKAAPKPRAVEAPLQNGATSGVDYAGLAQSGNLDALFGLMDVEASSANHRLVYKWLTAASDFGHEEAADLVGDVLEVSSLKDDEDGFHTAAAHWELASAYLEGTEGLPADLGLARHHLTEAFRHHDLDAISAATKEDYAADPLLERLDGEARALLEGAIAGDLGGAAEHDDGDVHDGADDDEDEAEAAPDGAAMLGGAGAPPPAEAEDADEEEFRGGGGGGTEAQDEDDDEDDGA